MLQNSKSANMASIEKKQIRENWRNISWVKTQLVGNRISH